MIIVLSNFFSHELYRLMNNIELGFSLFLVCFSVYLLIRFYFRYKNSDGKMILTIFWFSFIMAFSPSVVLYAVPLMLFEKPLFSAEFTGMFLLIIPLTFVYLQLVERLFDIDFLISRLRYYSLLSFSFATVITLVLGISLKLSFTSSTFFFMFFLVFFGMLLFLYIKEYIDYEVRDHLFSKKENMQTNLYKFFQKTKYETNVWGFNNQLMNEMKEVLKVEEVHYIEILANKDGDIWTVKTKRDYSAKFVEEIERVKWNNEHPGSNIEFGMDFVF